MNTYEAIMMIQADNIEIAETILRNTLNEITDGKLKADDDGRFVLTKYCELSKEKNF